jgi:hypothetical protein
MDKSKSIFEDSDSSEPPIDLSIDSSAFSSQENKILPKETPCFKTPSVR